MKVFDGFTGLNFRFHTWKSKRAFFIYLLFIFLDFFKITGIKNSMSPFRRVILRIILLILLRDFPNLLLLRGVLR